VNRQERRKFIRTAEKKLGQLQAANNELKQDITVKRAKENYKAIARLKSDLVEMGVFRRVTRWERLKAKFKSILRW
jgi:hypothetical protein